MTVICFITSDGTIFVNAHDIYRLSIGLRLAPERFVEIYGAKDYSLGIKVKEGLVDLALKQKDGRCMFRIYCIHYIILYFFAVST